MRLSGRVKYLVIANVALAVFIGGSYFYMGYALSHMDLNLSGLGTAVDELAATVEVATLRIPRCDSSVDHLAGGDRTREATMLYAATVVDLYKTTFGKLPTRIEDLDKLPDFENADRLNSRRIEKSCTIQAHHTGSLVLVCGAPLPDAKDIEAIVAKQGHVQAFEIVGGTEILYVPAIACSQQGT